MRVGFDFGEPIWLLAWPAALLAVFWIARAPGRRGPGRAAIALRALVASLLALALAAPQVLAPAPEGATWVLADASDSMRWGADDNDALRRAFENAPADLKTGLIAFGARASVEAPLSDAHRFVPPSVTDAGESKLSSALELALMLLPSSAAGRIAVVSDGLVDDLHTQTDMLAARGVPVDVLIAAAPSVRDAQLTELTLPGSAREGQSLPIEMAIDANFETDATLVLYANREPVATRAVHLRKGENRFVFEDAARKSGVVTYEALLSAEGDERPQNNRRAAYVRVAGTARVLLVEGGASEGRELSEMLSKAGYESEVISPAQLPPAAEALRAYDAVALVNVDAADIAPAQLDALDTAVRALGRGLAVFGGDASYALGGYRGSALEKILPVSMDVRSTLDLPSLALMLVIDKSGSMAEGRYGTSRLELAQEAAMRACEVLTERDQVGVIAFDDSAKWVSPLQLAEDVPAIQAQIGTIRPGGGTAFFGPLHEAYEALERSDAPQKHIIFLTDGEPADSGFEALAAAYAGAGITLTTVAAGSGANAQLLARLAAAGGGRAYAPSEFDDLPKIFTKETYLAAGAYVQNRRFTPAIADHGSLTDYPGFPALDGYLATTAKALATVSLVSDRDDPILAHWRYGAGTVLCWTSDLGGAWTGDFLNWSEAAAFFSGLIAFALPEADQSGVLRAEVANGALRVRYEQPADATEEALDTQAQALLPGGAEVEFALTEVAPGAFEGEIPSDGPGAYALTVRQWQGRRTVRLLEGGAAVNYSGEYDLRNAGGASALEALAGQTGGRVLSDAAELFAERGAPVRARIDLTPFLLAAALALFLLDATLNRLGWPRKSARAPRRFTPIAKPRKRVPSPPPPAATPGDVERLLEARRNRKKL